MRRTIAYRPYEWLAEYYGQAFTFHLSWYEAARQGLLDDILLRSGSACDLACGTSATALSLAGGGIKAFGVDPSPIMCRLSRDKARRACLPLHVIQVGMPNFTL